MDGRRHDSFISRSWVAGGIRLQRHMSVGRVVYNAVHSSIDGAPLQCLYTQRQGHQRIRPQRQPILRG
eukprot:6486973-Pyramimonas_sp.AAC.1